MTDIVDITITAVVDADPDYRQWVIAETSRSAASDPRPP